MKKIAVFIAAFAVAAVLIGCEKKGTLESAGQQADQALQEAGSAVQEVAK